MKKIILNKNYLELKQIDTTPKKIIRETKYIVVAGGAGNGII